jgi:peptidyl-prolyl cis-trans isomerase D
MAIFNAINKRSGLVVGTVVVALALFILTDLFFGQNSIFQGSENKVGEISGHTVSIEEYQQHIAMAEQNFVMQNNRAVSENDRAQIQETAWNQLIFEYSYREEFEKLGLTITDEEWLDLARGNFIHPVVKQLFGDPENFDKSIVEGFLASLSQRPQQDQALWSYVDYKLPEIRIREKYSNLLKMTEYVTTAEAKREHAANTQKATIKYLTVPFFNISDSTVTVTDAELQKYLSKHSKSYQTDASRSLDYVVFNVKPTKEDSLAISQELELVAVEFKSSANDSSFVQFNSDEPVSITFARMGELAEGLQNAGIPVQGEVYGPFLLNNSFKLYKVLGQKEDSVYSARASHILFKSNGDDAESKSKAKAEAQKVLTQLKGGASFEELAREFGTDGTASKGGDLGWFTEGMMVGPFNDAIFGSTRTGLLPNLVETQFGYHIIKIDDARTKKLFKIAEVNRNITYSEETKEDVYQSAVNFAEDVADSASFYAKVKESSDLIITSANNLRQNDRSLNSMRNAREIIKWAYKDASPGDISDVMTIEDQFVVAVLKSAKDKGTANLADVREEVANKVRMEKKAEIISEKLKGLSGTFEEMAAKYGPGASAGIADAVTMNSNYVTGLGYDPIAVGRIFGLKANQKTAPITGQTNVSLVELTSIEPVQEIADYAANKNQIAQQRGGRADFLISETIKKASDVKDTRYKFF